MASVTSATAKPIVLICSTPVSGHIIPMIAIAKQLVQNDYDVCFVSGSGYRRQVEAFGASFVSVRGYGDFYDLTSWDLDQEWPEGSRRLEGPECFIHDLVHLFCKSLPSQHEAIQEALGMLKDKHPGRPVILMTETLNFGGLPTLLGAPGIRPQGTIMIGINPVLLTSVDHPPFGSGMLPDSSPEGRRRNKAANETQRKVFTPAQAAYAEALMSVGARRPNEFLLDALYSLPDHFVQMCTSSVEYSRSDAPDTIRFAGGYPVTRSLKEPVRPSWWNRVVLHKTKKIVFVCQGTASMDFDQLVVPTMTAFKDRTDITIIIALGRRDATLADVDVDVPENCVVEEYIPYDDILPYCDVFVTTAGYGSFQRALIHGCPLVMAGTTEEKPETAARGEWAGVGLNLRTSYPSVQQIGEAVDDVLHDQKYKVKALKIKAEMATQSPMGVVMDTIQELVVAA
ncbi:udp-glucuronosyl udp-glucosyltransferase protein [Apiospora arundinis]|uniref:Udp-glucuronosyl udp-glucosyltransferase protein n=1 Tax=Apiospora arundinis TaxID=335852 RepID=A0ABR2I518_9PEZI